MFKWLKQKGATLVEYAVILGFIVIVGVAFMDNGMQKSITDIIAKVDAVFGIASKNNSLMGETFLNYVDELNSYEMNFKTKDGTIVQWGNNMQGMVYYSELFNATDGKYREYSLDEVLAKINTTKYASLFETENDFPENAVVFSDSNAPAGTRPDVFVAWTGATPKEGDKVKVVVAKLDFTTTTERGKEVLANKDVEYYVVESTYKDGSFTKDIIDSNKYKDLTKSNSISKDQVLKEYNK